ncbi:MAG: hypothetical protein DU489_07015 [Nitrosomonas sp.]|uniref:hypothetical protein n=1 Tax=Nitrosomonas sp. TaxID=42353 RepID=UPI0032EAE385
MSVSNIAKDHSVDNATIRYHVKQFEQIYGSTEKVYLLIKSVQKTCNHPSSKCLVCGVATDTTHRQELEQISQLKTKLAEVKAILARYGHEID